MQIYITCKVYPGQLIIILEFIKNPSTRIMAPQHKMDKNTVNIGPNQSLFKSKTPKCKWWLEFNETWIKKSQEQMVHFESKKKHAYTKNRQGARNSCRHLITSGYFLVYNSYLLLFLTQWSIQWLLAYVRAYTHCDQLPQLIYFKGLFFVVVRHRQNEDTVKCERLSAVS